jgi:hypothetical protein
MQKNAMLHFDENWICYYAYLYGWLMPCFEIAWIIAKL